MIKSVSPTGGPSLRSHHNVGGLPERMHMKLVEPLRELFKDEAGGLPERMHMKLVEPLRELFKDEARALGRELGLPDVFVGRHPFPRPGLAIRCLGEITAEKLEILRFAEA